MIPKVIHRIWFGDAPPQWIRPFEKTWSWPEWEIRQWSEINLFPLRNQAEFDTTTSLQIRSDIARYEILERFGGIYVDADFECLDFEGLITRIGKASSFAGWEKQDVWIANGLMGCTPGHSFLAKLVTALPKNMADRADESASEQSGPKFLTRQAAHGGLDVVLPQRLVYPYGYKEIDRFGPNDVWPDALCVHHWHNRRK